MSFTGRRSSPGVGAWRARFAVLAIVMSASVPLMPTAAQAYVSTCGPTSPSNYHVGWVDPNQDYVEGSYAVITTRYGSTCLTDTSSNNFTNQYSMVASGNGAGWAQVGYWRYYGSSTYYFGQIVSGHTVENRFGTTSPLTMGSTHYYYNKYGTTCLCMNEIIDATLWMSSGFNPWTAWTQPFRPQFTGETKYAESDVSGTSSAPASYTNLGAQSDATDNWGLMACGQLSSINDVSVTRSDGKSWHDPLTSCPSFNVYTG